jgi:hypothetical protein
MDHRLGIDRRRDRVPLLWRLSSPRRPRRPCAAVLVQLASLPESRSLRTAALREAALFLIGAPAQAERAERDPDKMAVIAATIFIFDRDCEKVSPKLEEAAGVATEVAGKPKVAAVIMRIEDQIEKDGKEAWCALARENFPPLTER